jgi:hypothetical protein
LKKYNRALSKPPKMFEIQDLEKGHYPHLWNTNANENAQPYSQQKMLDDRIDSKNWHDYLTSHNFIFSSSIFTIEVRRR